MNIDTSKPISVEQYRAMINKKSQIEEFAELIKKPKKSKYNAQKTNVDDITFDSKAEAKRYGELMLLYKAKKIGKPILQYEFELSAGIKYRCDFLYICFENRNFVVEDVKGVKTPEYKLKKKLMKEIYGIEIYETS